MMVDRSYGFDALVDRAPEIEVDCNGWPYVRIPLPNGEVMTYRASEIVATVSPVTYEGCSKRWVAHNE